MKTTLIDNDLTLAVEDAIPASPVYAPGGTATATGSKPEGECSSKALFMRSFSRELTSHSFSSAFRLPRATMKGEASALSAAFRTAVRPLRVLHWTWVLCIIGLSATGICIAEGWFLKMGDLHGAFQFGTLRFVHYALGWILVVVMMLRFSCFFMASNKYQSFRALFPVSRQEWKDLYATAVDYLFARSYDGPRYIGHNPLQQWTYTGVYVLFTTMVVTGLALYALYEPRHWFYRWFMPLNDLIGIPYVRLVHLIGMWCFIIFAMIHVYLSILSGNVDRDGTISSMFSGGRWLRKGVKFRDE